MAAAFGQLEVVRLLLDKGANMEAADEVGALQPPSLGRGQALALVSVVKLLVAVLLAAAAQLPCIVGLSLPRLSVFAVFGSSL